MAEFTAKDALKKTNKALADDLGKTLSVAITDELFSAIAEQAKSGYTNLEFDYTEFKAKVCKTEIESDKFDWGERGLRFIMTSLGLYGYRANRSSHYISIHWG